MREWQRREAQQKWWRDMLDKTNDPPPPLTIDVHKPSDPGPWIAVWGAVIFIAGIWLGYTVWSMSGACG